MLNTLKGRIAVILVILAVSGWSLYSNYHGCRVARAQSGSLEGCSPIKLGLDLQGGMHLVMEVQDSAGTMTAAQKADATDRALKVIRTRIDQFGVEEPLIQKVGNDRIIVDLAGIRNEGRAKDILEKTAFLEFYLVKGGRDFRRALPRLDRAIVDAGLNTQADTTQQPSQGQEVRKLIFGDTTAQDTTGGTAAPEENRRPLTSLLMESGNENIFLVEQRNVDEVDQWLKNPAVAKVVPRAITLRWGAETEARGTDLYRSLYVLEPQPFMTGDVLEDAQAGRDQQYNQTIVTFQLNRRGGRTFERVTSENIGELIAIVLDGQVFSAPQVKSRIGSRGQIELGQAPMTEARDLALVLRAGALPAPLHIIEERTIGPSLGHDSIAEGEVAGILGIILVIVVMVGYYRLAGLLAVLALTFYVALVMGGLAAFNATLTLPGIAGFVLSIGMAVDANVLIFERIREELRIGKTVRSAIEQGFGRAFMTILDCNATTLVAAFFLFSYGTGPVKGFAVTLTIGLLASMFTSVFVSRQLFEVVLLFKGRKA
ncbi:MAG TPA: protein translocase subunit SecD, partial [Longimicrobiales bacterium]|nr:protein translocase subunit SecD [Longimicrobiales bacterium]